MLRFFVSRLVSAIPVLFGVSLAVFLMIHLLPGDPATIMLQGAPASAQDIQNLRHQLGLDQPLYVQYFKYMERVVRGDFGISIHTRRPVLTEIVTVFPSTLQLALAAMGVAVVMGIILGIVAALRHNTWVDTLSMGVALFGVSMPNFWIGLLLILVSRFASTGFQRSASAALHILCCRLSRSARTSPLSPRGSSVRIC